MHELLETIFEKFGMVRDGRGSVADARSVETPTDWECLEHIRGSDDAQIGCGSVATYRVWVVIERGGLATKVNFMWD